jgi:MerR family transcriptional regulator/heat shock protein HspR
MVCPKPPWVLGIRDTSGPEEEGDEMEIPDDSVPLITIGVAARKLGVSESTLRLYEREGLLVASKTRTGRRLYSLNDLRVVHCIRALIQEHGLNFAGIRALFSKIPCWSIRKCSKEERGRCSRSEPNLIPCWLMGGTGCGASQEDCKECPVYAAAGRATLGPVAVPAEEELSA